MLFIGLELGASSKKDSVVAIMEGDEFSLRLRKTKTASKDEDIITAISEHILDKPAFVAINAPLIVQRRKKQRHADELISLLFGQYGADQYLAKRAKKVGKNGKTRGGAIVDELRGLRIKHSPHILPLERSRKCFEVYPYASMIVLFNLSRSLAYKARPKRDELERWDAFKKLQQYLSSLKNVHLPASLLKKDVTLLEGERLEEYESNLEAVFSAYLAWYAWQYPKKCEVLGTMHEGYILTPVMRRKEKQFEDYFKKAQSL